MELGSATIFFSTNNKKHVQGYGFLSFARKYKKNLLNTGLDSSKTASKKVVRNAGNKIADTVTKSNDDKVVKQEPVEEIIIPPEKNMKY